MQTLSGKLKSTGTHRSTCIPLLANRSEMSSYMGGNSWSCSSSRPIASYPGVCIHVRSFARDNSQTPKGVNVYICLNVVHAV